MINTGLTLGSCLGFFEFYFLIDYNSIIGILSIMQLNWLKYGRKKAIQVWTSKFSDAESQRLKFCEASWDNLEAESRQLPFNSITLEKKSGKGGFGDVYFGYQSTGFLGLSKSEVAVKKMSGGDEKEDAKIRVEIASYR